MFTIMRIALLLATIALSIDGRVHNLRGQRLGVGGKQVAMSEDHESQSPNGGFNDVQVSECEEVKKLWKKELDAAKEHAKRCFGEEEIENYWDDASLRGLVKQCLSKNSGEKTEFMAALRVPNCNNRERISTWAASWTSEGREKLVIDPGMSGEKIFLFEGFNDVQVSDCEEVKKLVKKQLDAAKEDAKQFTGDAEAVDKYWNQYLKVEECQMKTSGEEKTFKAVLKVPYQRSFTGRWIEEPRWAVRGSGRWAVEWNTTKRLQKLVIDGEKISPSDDRTAVPTHAEDSDDSFGGFREVPDGHCENVKEVLETQLDEAKALAARDHDRRFDGAKVVENNWDQNLKVARCEMKTSGKKKVFRALLHIPYSGRWAVEWNIDGIVENSLRKNV